MSSKFTRFNKVFKIIISLLILFYLSTILDLSLIQELMAKMNIVVFILSLLLALIRVAIGGMRWKKLLEYKNYIFPIQTLTKYYFIGAFFNFFFPTAVGGDVARGYYLYNQGVAKEKVVSSIVVERTLGLMSLAVLSLFSLLIGFEYIQSSQIKTNIIFFSLIIIVLFYLLFYWNADVLSKIIPDKFKDKTKHLNSLIHDLKSYKNPRVLLYGFIITILFQIIGIASTYLIALALGSSIEFIYFMILLPVIWLISMIPISLNGLGVREGAFVFLFLEVGMDKEMAVAISALFLFQMIIQSMIGSVFFLREKKDFGTLQKFSNSG